MNKKTIGITCLAAFLGGCGEGSGTNTGGGFDGFTVASLEPVAGAALPTSGAAVSEAGNVSQAVSAAQTDLNEQASAASISSNVVDASTEVEVSPYVASIATNSESLVTVPESESSELVTTSEFLFDTARTVRLKVDLPSTVGTQGILSVCTDFQETTAGFDINYNKCPIRGTIDNGQFQKDLSLMNQFDSAIAVIWYRNQELETQYKKFNTADLVEGSDGREWLWN